MPHHPTCPNAVMESQMSALLHALSAIDAQPVRVVHLPTQSSEPYRGAQFGRAGDGDEWTRVAQLKQAGQGDMFEVAAQ